VVESGRPFRVSEVIDRVANSTGRVTRDRPASNNKRNGKETCRDVPLEAFGSDKLIERRRSRC